MAKKQDIDELVQRSGFRTHSRWDDCEGCHRARSIGFVATLPMPFDGKVALTNEILERSFLG